MKNQEFSLGDIVRLKSGGPWLTIAKMELETDSVEVVWFDNDESLHRGVVSLSSLKKE